MPRMLARAHPDHHLSGCGRPNRCCALPLWRKAWRRKRNPARENTAWRREASSALAERRSGEACGRAER